MDIFLEKFSGKINTQSLLRTIEELKTEFVDDGITKEDLPPDHHPTHDGDHEV